MMLYLFLLLKSFKLETRFINIQQDTLTFTDLIPVEQILKKISILFQGPGIWNSSTRGHSTIDGMRPVCGRHLTVQPF